MALAVLTVGGRGEPRRPPPAPPIPDQMGRAHVVARRAVSQPGHRTVVDDPEYGLVLLRQGRRWLVDAPSDGG